MSTVGWARPVRAAAVVVAGIAVTSALFLPLHYSGMGSREPAYRLAGMLAAGTLEPLVPAWLGFILLALPMIGALLLATALGTARWLSVLRFAGASAALAVVAAATISTDDGSSFIIGPALLLVATCVVGMWILLCALAASPVQQRSLPHNRSESAE